MNLQKIAVAGIVVSVFALTGCGAMSTAVKKRNLDVKTQMSETIWLDPSSEKTVYVQVRNTSDRDMSGLQTKIAQELTSKGYHISNSPDAAYYWVQANVLKAEKMDLRESQSFLQTGYEGGVTGAALGAGIAAFNTGSTGAVLGVGLATGLIGMAADAMVEDVNYTMVTDLQISEHSKTSVTTNNVETLKQGTSGVKQQTSSAQEDRIKHQTRVVSNANKVNLKFEEAQPVLEAQLAKSVVGIM
jgi:hypothetical protein